MKQGVKQAIKRWMLMAHSQRPGSGEQERVAGSVDYEARREGRCEAWQHGKRAGGRDLLRNDDGAWTVVIKRSRLHVCGQAGKGE